MRKLLLLGAILFSAVLTWFAINNYSSARPIAEENLRGLALSLTTAIENIAVHDPSLHNLVAFQTHEIAFFAIVDRNGVYRFHSNPDLIGKPGQGAIPLATIREGVTTDERITLRTGENAFQFDAPQGKVRTTDPVCQGVGFAIRRSEKCCPKIPKSVAPKPPAGLVRAGIHSRSTNGAPSTACRGHFFTN